MKLYYYKVIILNFFFYYKMIINKTCNKQRENYQKTTLKKIKTLNYKTGSKHCRFRHHNLQGWKTKGALTGA